MLPTCLLSDVIAFTEMILPAQILLPSATYCNNNQSSNCLTPCETLNFTSWADPLLFAVCDTDPQTCQYLAKYNLPNNSLSSAIFQPFQTKIYEKLSTPNSTIISSKICTLVTWIETVPVFIILLTSGVFTTFTIQVLTLLIPQIIGVTAQVLAFHRTV